MPPVGECPPEEIQPLKTLEELLEWRAPKEDVDEVVYVASLSPRSPPRSPTHLKTLLCHDMMGGYLDDRFYQGCDNKDAYRFYHWSGVDTFVYFSHNLVTIPPPCWINAAHRHGVKVLGTLITEWDSGEAICRKMLADKESISTTVSQLVRVAKYHRFDGWLVNIENKIDPEQIEGLINFLQMLMQGMKEVWPGCEVIWYDSVTKEGKLEWQNELNQLNRPFFDACDGIFLNYTWTPDHLERSCVEAGEGLNDRVYVGIDVFGRNFYEGGKFNTCKALEMARSHKLSVAVFAPGWTYETQDNFVAAEKQLWSSLSPQLTHTGPGTLPVHTSFCQGYGQCCYVRGKIESNDPWHNLSKQQLQPLWSQEREGTELSLVTSDAFSGGGCLGISMKTAGDVRLFVCGIRWRWALIVGLWYKWKEPAVPFSLLLHLRVVSDTSKNSPQERIIELKCEGRSEVQDEAEKSGEEESIDTGKLNQDNSTEREGEDSKNNTSGSCEADASPVFTSVENGWMHKTFSVKEVKEWELCQINVRLEAPSSILIGQLDLSNICTKGYQ